MLKLNQSDQQSDLKVSFIILAAIFWCSGMLYHFHQDFKEMLTEYELGHKIHWNTQKETYIAALEFQYVYKKGKELRPRGPQLIVKNLETGQLMVNQQFSDFKVFNPEVKLLSGQLYVIRDAEFYHAPDDSVMLQRDNLYWLSKATVWTDTQLSSRIYVKNDHPIKAAGRHISKKYMSVYGH